ncbi:PA4642 family protein [Atopomonas sediminilitoris]|uniref:PA4642 family protein n=1 Tax=Atopomonas sediminilitoris TaxID=2919919 RepID=UPI001F4E60D7|nr:PA4642 family protein [Atopomonas sediminilitoris]MCJ8168747.1 PA4642 family protein [Atopomonas sediminilitoris]
MAKEKRQIIGEPMTDDQVKVFLDVAAPADGTPRDLHVLVSAYRGLREDDFVRFLGYFKAAGLNLNATDSQGRDFVALIADQRLSEPYVEAINAARA